MTLIFPILESTNLEAVISAHQKFLPKMSLRVEVHMLVETNQNFRASRSYPYPLNFLLELTFPYVLVKDFMRSLISSYKNICTYNHAYRLCSTFFPHLTKFLIYYLQIVVNHSIPSLKFL